MGRTRAVTHTTQCNVVVYLYSNGLFRNKYLPRLASCGPRSTSGATPSPDGRVSLCPQGGGSGSGSDQQTGLTRTPNTRHTHTHTLGCRCTHFCGMCTRASLWYVCNEQISFSSSASTRSSSQCWQTAFVRPFSSACTDEYDEEYPKSARARKHIRRHLFAFGRRMADGGRATKGARANNFAPHSRVHSRANATKGIKTTLI